MSPPRPATIEVTVETLSGSGFRLRVSPAETVLSVKARIQRIEGVAASQQHLIYQERELADPATLAESGVTAGARLRLVVAMRGGPVNTRRLPIYDDITHAEMQQLLDMDSGRPWEGDGAAGRQVTLLVFRDGDRVNFYRVLENTDGTFSPLSDSWGSSIRNMFDEENGDEMKARVEENAATMSKVLDLKQKMQKMSLRKRRRLPPSRGSAHTSVSSSPRAAPSSVHLPPVPAAGVRPSASLPSATAAGDSLSESFSRLAAPRRRQPVPETAARGADGDERQLTSRGQLASGRTSGRRRKLSLSESTELFRQLQAQRGLSRAAVPETRDYAAYRRSLARLARHPSLSPADPQPAEPPPPTGHELPVLFETDERRGGGRPRTSPGHRLLAKDDAATRVCSPTLSLRPTDGRARQLCRILSARAAPAPAAAAAGSQGTPPGTAAGQAPAPAPPAPPAPRAARAKRPRCQVCRRRLGLAAVYSCHCAAVFCSQHRYPESHRCSHDFKAEGRRLLHSQNPLVTAQKLPKI